MNGLVLVSPFPVPGGLVGDFMPGSGEAIRGPGRTLRIFCAKLFFRDRLFDDSMLYSSSVARRWIAARLAGAPSKNVLVPSPTLSSPCTGSTLSSGLKLALRSGLGRYPNLFSRPQLL